MLKNEHIQYVICCPKRKYTNTVLITVQININKGVLIITFHKNLIVSKSVHLTNLLSKHGINIKTSWSHFSLVVRYNYNIFWTRLLNNEKARINYGAVRTLLIIHWLLLSTFINLNDFISAEITPRKHLHIYLTSNESSKYDMQSCYNLNFPTAKQSTI